MRNKKITFAFFVAFIYLISFAFAIDAGNIQGELQDKIGDLEKNVSKAREFTEKDKWTFIKEQWQGILLKNKYIAGVNGFFTKIDIVFVVLFAHKWELSVEMFFVFMLWIFTFLFLKVNMFFLNVNWEKWVTAFLGVLALAHLKVFNKLSEGMFKIVFYKDAVLWKTFVFVGFFVLFVLYYKLGGVIEKWQKKRKEKKEKEKLENRVGRTEEFQKGVKSGIKEP